jgi:hypothetical protein
VLCAALAAWSRSCRAGVAAWRAILAATLTLACVFLLQSASADATTVTLTPEADTWVSSDAPTANHGSDTTLPLGGYLSPTDRRTYVRFNSAAAGIPPGAVVTRTTLNIYFESAPAGGFQLRITNPRTDGWNEGTMTWNDPPNTPPSFTGPVSGETGVITPGPNSISAPFITPGNSITYVLTRQAAESATIGSRESSHSPKLVVEYALPSATPSSVCSAIGCIESTPWIVTNTWALVVADFNGDGREDHFVGRHGGGPQVGNEQIYLQQSDGSFAPGFQFPIADRHGCATGDVNGDGKTDMYCERGADGGEDLGQKHNELWIQQPDGTYADQAAAWGVTDTMGRGRRPLLFDFSHDGKPDLYITNFAPGPDGASGNQLFINFGNHFEAKVVSATGDFGSACVDDGDWDHDGSNFRDFLVCGAELNLFHNSGSTHETEQRNGVLGSPLLFPTDAKLADVNGDGWDDLVVTTETELQIRLNLKCATCNRFAQVDFRAQLVDGVSVAVGDLNGDGYQDVYVVEGVDQPAGADGPRNTPDDLFIGPNWTPVPIPETDTGTGDHAEFINVGGHENLIVTNGLFFSRGPVQFISFKPNAVTPPPSLPPSSGPPPPPPPAGSAKLAKLPKAAAVVQLPSSRRCANRNNLRIRIRRVVGGVTFVSAAVFVNNKRVKVVKRNGLTAPIKLRGLPKRKFTIKVVVNTSDGRKLSRLGKYRACAKKRRA